MYVECEKAKLKTKDGIVYVDQALFNLRYATSYRGMKTVIFRC